MGGRGWVLGSVSHSSEQGGPASAVTRRARGYGDALALANMEAQSSARSIEYSQARGAASKALDDKPTILAKLGRARDFVEVLINVGGFVSDVGASFYPPVRVSPHCFSGSPSCCCRI